MTVIVWRLVGLPCPPRRPNARRSIPPFSLNDSKMYVINLALPTLRGPYGDQYGLVLGGAVIAVIPIIIIFFAMQRYFIEGIMAGALKG